MTPCCVRETASLYFCPPCALLASRSMGIVTLNLLVGCCRRLIAFAPIYCSSHDALEYTESDCCALHGWLHPIGVEIGAYCHQFSFDAEVDFFFVQIWTQKEMFDKQILFLFCVLLPPYSRDDDIKNPENGVLCAMIVCNMCVAVSPKS